MNTDGSFDSSFAASANGSVLSIVVQPDGKVVLGGYFTALNGQTSGFLGGLNPNGTFDTTFLGSADSTVTSLALQRDGKILVGGAFKNLCGQPRSHIGRLNLDGSLDVNFDPGADRNVTALAVQPDENILVGGNFIVLATQSRTNNAGTVATFTASASGTTPLKYSWQKNGVDLQDGGNISGAQSPTLSISGVLGADAGDYSVVVTNDFGSTASTAATLTVADPFITAQPSSQSINAGQSAAFTIGVLGTDPLNYQWRKAGVPLSGQDQFSGIQW